MAFLRQAKTEDELKKLTLSGLKKAYIELAKDYNKILDGDYAYCHHCNQFLSRDTSFYSSNNFASGLFPVCKKCLLEMVEQRTKRDDKPNETKESVQKVLQFMDLPYIDSLYESTCKTVADEVNEKNRKSPFLAYLVPIKSLPQYKNKTWKDSEFDYSANDNGSVYNEETIRKAKKRFGTGYSDDDYMFLEDEYQDWVTRYECNTKTQESLFERLTFKKWEISKATKQGKSTKDLDKTYQEIMATANIQPRQTGVDSVSDAQTLGTLIAKWETERPLPEIDEELRDVDNIGQYIDVFFRGHMAKMLGLANPLSHLYHKFMEKFTVKRPEYSDDENSEALFDAIFGNTKDDEE